LPQPGETDLELLPDAGGPLRRLPRLSQEGKRRLPEPTHRHPEVVVQVRAGPPVRGSAGARPSLFRARKGAFVERPHQPGEVLANPLEEQLRVTPVRVPRALAEPVRAGSVEVQPRARERDPLQPADRRTPLHTGPATCNNGNLTLLCPPGRSLAVSNHRVAGV